MKIVGKNNEQIFSSPPLQNSNLQEIEKAENIKKQPEIKKSLEEIELSENAEKTLEKNKSQKSNHSFVDILKENVAKKSKNKKIHKAKKSCINQNFSDIGTPKPYPKKKWTVIHYAAGDNNLGKAFYHDVNLMEKAGPNKNVEIVSLYDDLYGGCKEYHIEKDNDINRINSTMIADHNTADMSDPKTLKNFITRTMKKYPAENYMLMFSSHGHAWKGIFPEKGKRLPLPEIKNAINEATKETGEKIDIIGFDSCLMATGEAASELKDSADYMVASEMTEKLKKIGEHYVGGWPDEEMVKALNNENITPKELAKQLVENGKIRQFLTSTLSAVDLSKVRNYEKVVDEFSQAIINTDTPNKVLKDIINKSQKFKYERYRDQYHFAKLISESPDIKDENLITNAKKLMTTMKEDGLIINNQSSEEFKDAYGLSVTFPDKKKTPKSYNDLEFSKNTHWDEAVEKMRIDE